MVYAEQKAAVLADKVSDVFGKKEENEAGWSIIQFLSSTHVFTWQWKTFLARWQKNMGKCFGDFESHCLTNLRFADDVLLFSTSPEQLQKMLCDFKHSTERVGLKIHLEKTNILGNQRSNRRRKVTINNIEVEILPVKECAKFLGQTITFQQQETT